eukprot:TRINITY_DN6056_c0_g1_i1.p1 TRINITY_DN6056_c0_g1~~TRINITY_DN6056_c0_g1_i1.p1  ORF type:complete len:990 (+),score=136.95 TRINITY_DN6056_c0_g1_i1:62-3031(+)
MRFFVALSLLPALTLGTILTACLNYGDNTNDGCETPCNSTFGRGRDSDGTTIYYGDFESATSPYNGYYVCEASSACTRAPPSSESGNDYYCLRCLGGFYCPVGTIFPDDGDAESNECAEGSTCEAASTEVECEAGTYCPEGSVTPSTCCPTGYDSCASSGYYCPSGSSELGTCSAGYYCTNNDVTDICPSGSFCPAGAAEPVECSIYYTCPEGSATRDVSALTLTLTLVTLALISVGGVVWGVTDKRRSAKELSEEEMAALGCSEEHGPIEHQISLSLVGLGLSLPSGKRILQEASADIPPGSVLALMGPSGSGKTSLLNVLSGRAFYGKTTGKVLISGEESGFESIVSRVGFVPQDDVVHSDLSIRENLYYSAMVRLCAETSKDEVDRVVNHALEYLLLKHVQDSMVGDVENRGISGGQRKRVNIGIELVAQPSILFLDEPTSGLDATTALALMYVFKDLARTGVTIMSVIHQPRPAVFFGFDSVLLLCPGGKVVFEGPVEGAVPYMESLGLKAPPNENPADWLMDIITRVPDEELEESPKETEERESDKAWRESVWFANAHQSIQQSQLLTSSTVTDDLNANDLAEIWMNRPKISYPTKHQPAQIPEVTRPGIWRQFWIVLARDIQRRREHVFVDLVHMMTFIVAAAVVGLVTGNLGTNESPNFTTCYVFVALMTGQATLGTFANKRLIFWREISSGYEIGPFFLSQNILDFPLYAIYTTWFWIIFATLTTPLAGVSLTWATFVLVAFSSSGMAYFLATILDHPALIMVLFILLLNVVLNGVFNGADLSQGLPLPYFLSPSRYSVEMIEVSHYDRFSAVNDPAAIIDGRGWAQSTTGDDHWSPARWLVLQGVLWRIGAYLGLYACNRGQMAKESLSLMLLVHCPRLDVFGFLDYIKRKAVVQEGEEGEDGLECSAEEAESEARGDASVGVDVAIIDLSIKSPSPKSPCGHGPWHGCESPSGRHSPKSPHGHWHRSSPTHHTAEEDRP